MHITMLGFDVFKDLLHTDSYFAEIVNDVQDGKRSDFILHNGFL